MTTLRTMTLADLPLGMRLKEQARWNQTESDWRRFLALAPEGCFVAECDGAGVGTVAAFSFGPVAWIAMVLVDESMRGRGLGTALMTHALAQLDQRGIASVRLDATPLGRPLYEKLGFSAQFEVVRWAGVVSAALRDVEPPPRVVVDGNDPALPQAIDLDRRVTATDRAALLRALLRFGAGMSVLGDPVRGYAVTRPGASAAQIGPIIGDEQSGAALLRAALRGCVGRAVYVDIALPHEQAAAIAREAGLQEQRRLTRMCRGAMVCEDVQRLWASSGPEKG